MACVLGPGCTQVEAYQGWGLRDQRGRAGWGTAALQLRMSHGSTHLQHRRLEGRLQLVKGGGGQSGAARRRGREGACHEAGCCVGVAAGIPQHAASCRGSRVPLRASKHSPPACTPCPYAQRLVTQIRRGLPFAVCAAATLTQVGAHRCRAFRGSWSLCGCQPRATPAGADGAQRRRRGGGVVLVGTSQQDLVHGGHRCDGREARKPWGEQDRSREGWLWAAGVCMVGAW